MYCDEVANRPQKSHTVVASLWFMLSYIQVTLRTNIELSHWFYSRQYVLYLDK
jgi:hypothetical protein